MLALEPCVEGDVREDAAPEEIAKREDVPRVDRRHAGEAPAQPRAEVDALVRLKQQRVQVEHAELPVAGPRLALSQPLERADVDEHGLRSAPLDVVRRRVLQHQILVERAAKQLELEERGVAEHRERPLVRIRDERDPLVLENGRGAGDRDVVDLRRRDELALRDRLAEELRLRQRGPVRQAVCGERAQDARIVVEDATVPVAKGARLE